MFDRLYDVLWIAYLILAWFLHSTRRGNLPLIVGLVGMAVNPLFFTLLRYELLPYEAHQAFQPIQPFIALFAVAALVLGIVKLARGGAAASQAQFTDGASVNLGSLFAPRNTTNTVSRAETLRDAALERLLALAKGDRLQVVVQKSNPHSPSAWLRIDYSMPSSDPAVTLRAYVSITVARYDYHRFEHAFLVDAQVGTQRRQVDNVLNIDERAAREIHDFVTIPGKRLRLDRRFRDVPWALWRPVNKVQRIKADWVSAALLSLGVILLLFPPGFLVSAAIFLWFYLRQRKRRTHVLTTGRPPADPRSLRWMDSWQASIGRLAPYSDTVRQKLVEALTRGAPPELAVGMENFTYWGVDSLVSREQVAVRYRRALGFMHVVPYGDSLYVAWECHLNNAVWNEEILARGVDRVTGNDVVACRATAGQLALNEYDLADSNFLGEWMHESLKRELKLQMSEQKIDQEIDFTVQRESRKQALGGQPTPESSPLSKVKNRLARVQ